MAKFGYRNNSMLSGGAPDLDPLTMTLLLGEMHAMEPNYTISELINESYKTAVEKGWWEESGDRTVGTALMLMVTELAEAMEEHRHGRGLDEIWYQTDGKPEGIPVELADVIIRIADLCGHHKIDMNRALREKLAYNKTRPFRHGNKKA